MNLRSHPMIEVAFLLSVYEGNSMKNLIFRVPKFEKVDLATIDMFWHGRTVGTGVFSGFKQGFAYFSATITNETFAMLLEKGKVGNTDISLGYRYANN